MLGPKRASWKIAPSHLARNSIPACADMKIALPSSSSSFWQAQSLMMMLMPMLVVAACLWGDSWRWLASVISALCDMRKYVWQTWRMRNLCSRCVRSACVLQTWLSCNSAANTFLFPLYPSVTLFLCLTLVPFANIYALHFVRHIVWIYLLALSRSCDIVCQSDDYCCCCRVLLYARRVHKPHLCVACNIDLPEFCELKVTSLSVIFVKDMKHCLRSHYKKKIRRICSLFGVSWVELDLVKVELNRLY